MSKSLLGIAGQWSPEKIAILSLKPPCQVRILIYRTWAICKLLTENVYRITDMILAASNGMMSKQMLDVSFQNFTLYPHHQNVFTFSAVTCTQTLSYFYHARSMDVKRK